MTKTPHEISDEEDCLNHLNKWYLAPEQKEKTSGTIEEVWKAAWSCGRSKSLEQAAAKERKEILEMIEEKIDEYRLADRFERVLALDLIADLIEQRNEGMGK